MLSGCKWLSYLIFVFFFIPLVARHSWDVINKYNSFVICNDGRVIKVILKKKRQNAFHHYTCNCACVYNEMYTGFTIDWKEKGRSLCLTSFRVLEFFLPESCSHIQTFSLYFPSCSLSSIDLSSASYRSCPVGLGLLHEFCYGIMCPH